MAATSDAPRSFRPVGGPDVALVCASGVVLTATGGEWAYLVFQIGGAVLGLAGVIVVGCRVGWRSLPLVTVVVYAIGYLASAAFYDDQATVPPDLRVGGMDEIGRNPGSVVFLLPCLWVALVIAILLTRRVRRSRAAPSAAVVP